MSGGGGMTYLGRTVQELCARHGITVRILPRSRGCMELRFPDGQVRHVEQHRLGLNTAAATEMSRVKPWGLHFLRSAGVRIPEFDCFFRDDEASRLGSAHTEAAALEYARTLGYPVVIKPATLSYGRGVVLANDDEEARRLVSAVATLDAQFMVQRFVRGNEYRVVVLDGEVKLAYRKFPFTVIGDGRRSIDALVADRLDTLARQGSEVTIPPTSGSFDRMLRSSGRSRTDVLAPEEALKVGFTAGVQWGGYLEDHLDVVPAAAREVAGAIAHKAGLRFCGLDLMLEAGGDPDDPAAYCLIETNSSPSFDIYADLGPLQHQRAVATIESALLAMAQD